MEWRPIGRFRETRREPEAFIAEAKGRRALLREPTPFHGFDEGAHLAHPAFRQDRRRIEEQEPGAARLVGGGAEANARIVRPFQEMAAGDVGHLLGFVAGAPVGKNHLAHEARGGAGNQRAERRDERAFAIERRDDDGDHKFGNLYPL